MKNLISRSRSLAGRSTPPAVFTAALVVAFAAAAGLATQANAAQAVQAKLKHDENWTYYDDPLLPDLIELRDVLFRKYQRKHLSWEDLAAVEAMITEPGGTWEEAE